MDKIYRVVLRFNRYEQLAMKTLYFLIDGCIKRQRVLPKFLDELRKYGDIYIDRSGIRKDVADVSGLEKLKCTDVCHNVNFCFTIIVNVKEVGNPSDIMPLLLFQKEYQERIAVGLDIEDIPVEEQSNVIFKFSDFLLFVDNITPICGFQSIYFIDEKKETRNKQTDNGLYARYYYVSKNRVTSLRYKSPYSKRDIGKAIAKASRYFHPLLHVDKVMFGYLFQNAKTGKSDEVDYIQQSIDKLSTSVNGFTPPRQGYSSLFEQWFFLAFYHSMQSDDLEKHNKEALNGTLHDYYVGIYELVQNIIFHTEEQRGLLYVMFCKEEDMSDDNRKKLQCNRTSIPVSRYLKIGVYDFSSKGISDTYCKENNIQGIGLSELINPNKLPDINDGGELNYLAFTYAAHLGIKMLVSSVLSHNGWFKVESCQNGDKYALSSSASSLGKDEKVENIKGTHYEVLLPVTEFQKKDTYPVQSLSVADFLVEQAQKPSEINAINISECINGNDMNAVSSATLQWGVIERWTERIVSKMHVSNGACALNMEGINLLNPNQIFKLLASIQLKQRVADVLVMVNLPDNIIAHLCLIVRQVATVRIKKQQPLWSRDHAVVLMGRSFGAFVFCGETLAELSNVNKSMQHIYPGHENELTLLDESSHSDPKLDNVVKPYECLIQVNGTPLFLHLANRELDKHLGSAKGGYLIDRFRSKVGSKLYIDRFFEADTMFQNGFYVERYAYFIAKDILSRLSQESMNKDMPIVIVGCYSYSEPLTRRVQYYINQSKQTIVKQVVTAVEVEDENTMAFHWQDMQNWPLSSFNDSYQYMLIVPISSTMSSHDKTISLFKKSTGCSTLYFPFQYSVLLIRDGNEGQPATDIERDWNIVNISEKIAITSYKNTEQVRFFIEKSSCWHNLLDIQTFPEHFEDEVFLNRTKNASLNTQDFFGFPVAAIPHRDNMKKELLFINATEFVNNVNKEYYDLTCRRLTEMANNIQIGHIDHHNNHHRYYFNTESFVAREGNKELNKWFSYQKKRFNDIINKVDSVRSCIIITPDVNRESIFVDEVNRTVFDNNALVVHLDVYSNAENISKKYSFLHHLKKTCKFFFIDHAILTGGTFERTRHLMSFVNDEKSFPFDGIITVVNRLSRSLYKQIETEVGNYGIESFVWFSILPSHNTYTDCSLCSLKRHYDNLERCTVTHNVKDLCRDNSWKFHLTSQHYYKTKHVDSDNEFETASLPRRRSRMLIRNKLFYHISLLASNNNSEEKNDLDMVSQPKVEAVESYLKKEFKSLKDDIEEKISFLKAVTYPPLSQYVYIRQFAFRTNLRELSSVLSKETPDFSDFCLLKVILKHLGYLSSNALVRKHVIEGSWHLCVKVLQEVEYKLSQLANDLSQKTNKKKRVKKIETPDMFNSDISTKIKELERQKNALEFFKVSLLFYIKNAIYNDESKSFYIGELLRTGKEPDVTRLLETHATAETDLTFAIESRDGFLEFLDGLYYDNNTILRKTLSNFEKEISKDKSGLYLLFWNETKRLLPLNEFKANVNRIVELLLNVVKDNYYYTWFRLYVTEDSINKGQLIDSDKDGVPLIKKMVYLIYAKQLFDRIEQGNINNNNTYIQDVNTLLQLSMLIMDATDAFIVLRYGTRYIMLDHCGVNKINEQTESSYIELVENQCKEKSWNPFVIVEDEKVFSEFYKPCYKKACFFPLYGESHSQGEPLGMVGFLYDVESQKFRIRKQACARLLMLLVEELGRYINYCKAQKFLEIWYEQEETRRKYRKTNFTSNHRLHLGNWDFENLDTDNYVKINEGMFMMSNVVVSHIYSVISEEINVNFYSRNVSIDAVFSEKFIAMLNKLNDVRWGGNLKPVILGENHFNLQCNIVIMQSLIIQCIENAYGKYTNKAKTIKILFGKNSFSIYNTIVNIEKIKLAEDKRNFEKKYNERVLAKNVGVSRLSNYGMTLVSLSQYTKSVGLKCQWEFKIDCETPYFRIDITT